MIKRLGVAIAALLLLALSACGNVIKTDQQTQALWYESGEFQAQTFKDCIGPAVRDRKGMGDDFYRYPLGDRTWSFTGRPGSDAGPVAVKTKGTQANTYLDMTVLGFVQFTLIDVVGPDGKVIKANCDVLRTFHERIGLKYGAYFDDGASVSAGWIDFLNDYLAVPLNTVMDRGGLQSNVRALYSDQAAQDAFKLYVQNNLQAEVDKVLGREMTGFIKVKLVATETPQPPAQLLDSFKEAEASKANAEAKKTAAEADLAAQDAKTRLAAGRYKEVAECVKVLGADACFRLELQKGPNPPQWIPQGSQIHVDAKK